MAATQDKNAEKITGMIINSNKNILENIENYLQYIRENIKQIIIDDQLKYSDPMDKKKIYPDFSYTQFLYLLSRLYDRVFSVNVELLCKPPYYNNYNKPLYDIQKVELCYNVYVKLCLYYGYNCTIEPFYTMTGIGENTLREWLSCGYSDLFSNMLKNAKNNTIARFENSRNPLLSLASANYKYNIDKPLQEHTAAAAVDVLPDLLALSQDQKQLENPDK